MDVFAASENTFSAAHISKPKRIVDIPTHAPVQTRHDEVVFSSGTFTFPANSNWKDRFIVWRATGTVLTLEERSIRHSVIDSCIAFNFSRAPIVPGTTISLLSNLLSIVVTTQSSVHRFLCRLAVDESDDDSDSVESTLSQLLDVATSKDMMRTEFHDVHQLSARSTPSRAAVAVRPADTRVAVGLSDGQMVIVLMSNTVGGKTEELPISEAGFMQRFVGKTMTGFMDLCTSDDGRRHNETSQNDFTPFYTVNKDGTIRIVNGETYHTALSVPWSDFVTVEEEVLNASIRWRACGDFGLIVVAITTAEAVHFVILRDLEREQLVKVATARRRMRSRLVDFGVHEMSARETARLWIVAGIVPPEMGRDREEDGDGGEERNDEDSFVRPMDTYTLEYMDVPLPSKSTIRSGIHQGPVSDWKKVRGMGEIIDERKALYRQLKVEASMRSATSAASTNTKENVQLIRKKVFNVENNQFDVVLRAAKITTDNPAQFRVDHNDWTGLMSAVDGYIRSSEFERKFGSLDWQTTSVVASRDVRSEGELRFYRALSSSCAEIARSMARPLGLFMAPLAGTHLIGVIQETRLTVVVDACGELVERLSEEQLRALRKALEEAVKEEKKDAVSSPKARDMKRCKLQRMNSDEDSLSEAVALFVRRSKGLLSGETREGEDDEDGMEQESPSNSSDNSPTSLSSDVMSDEDCNSPYGGSFASGLIASLIRCRIVVEHKIASMLMMGIEKKTVCLEDYKTPLMDIIETLGILAAQLDIHVERDAGGWESLAGWLFSSQALPLLRIEGGYEIDVNMTGDEDEERPPLHQFINRSVMSILSAIHPLSPTQAIPKILATQDKNDTMKRVYSFWGEKLPAPLKYVVPYYNAIALSGTGMPRKALDQFKEAANGMRMGDKFLTRALVSLAVVRAKRLQEEAEIGIGVFYVNVIKVLNEHGHQQEVIDMSRESMTNLPEGSHLSSINATLFKRQVDGEQWSEALATIESTLDPSLRRHLLHELLSRLLQAGQWQIIIGADFATNTNMVESIIINHARSVDVSSANPHPFELVSAFQVGRSNYYQAALVQYELAVGLRNAPMTPEILMRCKRALTMTLTMLDLMPLHKRFIAFPHIAEFSSGKRKTMMIVKYDELKREWITLRGRCALLNAVNTSIPPDEPIALIKALTQARMYATAIELCTVLDEDPSAVIEHATTAAISIDVSGEEMMPSWVGANRRLAHKKEKNEHWSIVRALVKECRSRWPKDERCLRASLRAFLSHDIPLPYWLHTKYNKSNVGGYCRLLIDYGGTEAVDTALAVLYDCYKRGADSIIDAGTRTLLPHIVTEEVMEVAKMENSTETRMLLDKLDSMVRLHQQRATSFAKFT